MGLLFQFLTFQRRIQVVRGHFGGCGQSAPAGGDDILRRDGIGQQVPGHAVGGGGVKVVAREKVTGGALCRDGAVKKQSAAVGVSGTKADVVAHHDNGHAGGGQAAQNGRQLFLKGHVQTLGGLVQQ